MSEWDQLARTWQKRSSVLSDAELEALLRASRREAWRWRATWLCIQACVPLILGVAALMLWRADSWGIRAMAVGFVAVTLYAWLASRTSMARLVRPLQGSTREHLLAQLDRAQSMRRFVRIDFVVYAGMAVLALLFSLDHHTQGAWLGLDWRGRGAPLLLWVLVALGVVYDLYRLRSANRQRDRLQEVLAAMDQVDDDLS